MDLKARLAFSFISLLIINIAMMFIPIAPLQTNRLADNLNNCPYYISLQSILANFPLLANDKANVVDIKNRLLQFEKTINSQAKFSPLVAQYKANYATLLRGFSVTSAAQISQPNLILAVAKKTYPVIDNYYFDKRVSCVNSSLYEWNRYASRIILNYNLAGIFYDRITDLYARSQFMIDSGKHIGVFSGYFLNNQSTTLGTQFTTGIPLLTALYVLPHYSFAELGNYQGLVPWCAFSLSSAISNHTRKILDIAGIDYFVISKKDTKKIGTPIPNTTLLASNIKQRFGADDDIYRNNASYGVAYLANEITYENPEAIYPHEEFIKRYFRKAFHHNVNKFSEVTTALYAKLLKLDKKYDIVLESNSVPVIPNQELNKAAGVVQVKGISGPRIQLISDCQRTECTLVLNIAKASGWRAYVNNKPVEIKRANFAFMAITVPAGKTNVWFIRNAYSELLSYFASILCLGGILILTIMRMQSVN